MRAVVQRVSSARVTVDGALVGEIGNGLLVFVGVQQGDGPVDVRYIASKVAELRVFEEPTSPVQSSGEPVRRGLNRAVTDTGGAVLVVSQFTLCGDCRKGRRPSFDAAAPPATARALYEDVVRELRATGLRVETGEFQAMMKVELVNDGPVTLLLDSRKRF